MIEASSVDVARFRAAIARRLGLAFDDGKLEFLAAVLDRRLQAQRELAGPYLARLEGYSNVQAELREIAQELTVGETYFFRHNDQFRAFSEVALPARIEARASSRQLRLLSAGCSSGEEAYTLSILTRQHLLENHLQFEVAIRGVDINPRVIERARAASYTSWALRETPEAVRKQYFAGTGRDHVLSKAIRDSVLFEEENLVADDSWAPESYDVVFCRNVLMYFTPENAQRVVKRFSRALAPGGYLFLGHAENLRGLSLDFELRHTHATFYYQRKPVSGETCTVLETLEQYVPPPRAALALDWASTWLETVQRSSDRIRTLTAKNAELPAPIAARPQASSRADLGRALELLSQERFAEALEALPSTPSNSAKSVDEVLLARRAAHPLRPTGRGRACLHRALGDRRLERGRALPARPLPRTARRHPSGHRIRPNRRLSRPLFCHAAPALGVDCPTNR